MAFVTGSAGNIGKVESRYTLAKNVAADVVPVEPTATGTFAKLVGPDTFPALGAGLWFINTDVTDPLHLGNITIAPGVVINGTVAPTITFFTAQTPSYVGNGTAKTAYYRFYSVGSWG